MILELDAGNTRIKWRTVSEGSLVSEGAVIVQNRETAASDLGAQLGNGTMPGVERIRVSSVRGEAFGRAFTTLARETWQLQPEFACVTSEAAGVTNAYKDVSTMGVDRWLAILAAYARAGADCCVLDCGSAITFDRVDSAGSHRGGYIVPGMHLMRLSLAGKTRALDIPFEEWEMPVPGNSTRAAIGNGILAMVSGFAAHCQRQVAGEGAGHTRWYLTGGDAGIVSKLLTWEHELVNDLVLDGLGLVLP